MIGGCAYILNTRSLAYIHVKGDVACDGRRIIVTYSNYRTSW
jgi:hypothetical protein